MNMNIANSTLLASSLLLAASSAFAQNKDILTQQYSVKIERYRSVWDKTIKEAGSPEGKVLIAAVASYFGVPESIVGIALDAITDSKQQGDAYYINYPPPPGYTICYAMPDGGPYHGVESSQDSTFNAVIRRPLPGKDQFEGLATYLVVPLKTSTTTRAMSTFTVAFVKNPPGGQQHPQCRPTGEAAWLSRNNNTQLNVPCPHRDFCP
jgi:hypothetical protein